MPSHVVERGELERLIATHRADSRERVVLGLYYNEELTLREIAQVMDTNISRVSHLKAQAVLRLRTMIQTRWPRTRGK